MSDELRMELADCGSPEKLIGVILKHHADWKPPIPIEEFARTVGIEDFQDLTAETFEGALMTDSEKTRGIILIKASKGPKRRRFTIGHELGHFLIPSHKGNRQCTAADLREARRETAHQRQEAEANRFSAGLLMPRPWFVRDMRAIGEADVTHIQRLADDYDVSFEACANRYVELTDDTCAVVFSKDGVIRYVRWSTNFPFLSARKGDPLPKGSASSNAPLVPLRAPTPWADLDGAVWLETKWGKALPRLLEQSIRQAKGVQTTLLFLESREADEIEDVQLEESWTPRFRKR